MAEVVAASRAEDGCIDYAYAEDMLDPGLIRVIEAWRDQAALDRHFKPAAHGPPGARSAPRWASASGGCSPTRSGEAREI